MLSWLISTDSGLENCQNLQSNELHFAVSRMQCAPYYPKHYKAMWLAGKKVHREVMVLGMMGQILVLVR